MRMATALRGSREVVIRLIRKLGKVTTSRIVTSPNTHSFLHLIRQVILEGYCSQLVHNSKTLRRTNEPIKSGPSSLSLRHGCAGWRR